MRDCKVVFENLLKVVLLVLLSPFIAVMMVVGAIGYFIRYLRKPSEIPLNNKSRKYVKDGNTHYMVKEYGRYGKTV